MALLPDLFRAEDVKDDGGDFDLLPAGKYVAQVVKSEVRDTKSGTGKYISLQLKIIEGDHTGRVVFDMINVVNQNEVAQNIGQRQLKQLVEACELTEIEDTTELHAIPIQITVGIEPEKNGWPAKNKVKKYSKEDTPF
jgi:hypothetical protein